MDALVTECSWGMDAIMVRALVFWSRFAGAARTLLWFGRGGSGDRTGVGQTDEMDPKL